MTARCQVTGRTVGFGNSVPLAPQNAATVVAQHPDQGVLPSVGGPPHNTAVERQGDQGRGSRRHRGRGYPAPPIRSADLMARNEIRPIVKLRSIAGTGYTYITRKNRRNDPDRLTLKKYDPVIRRHVEFREER